MPIQPSQLPVPAESILHAYRQLIADIDTMIDKLAGSRFKAVMKCGPGCSGCCTQFSVLPLEAAIVSGITQSQRPAAGNDREKCLLLADDLCQIYEVRPVICRTQGLPLGYIDEEAGTIEVSACPLNFPDDYPLGHDDLLFMDRINRRLAELNLDYCRAAGLDPEKRISLADLASAA